MPEKLGGTLTKTHESLHGEPIQLQREQHHKRIADHEYRHRKRKYCQAHDGAIDPGSGGERGDRANRNRDPNGHDQGDDRERQRGLKALPDEGADGNLVENRCAQIPLKHRSKPLR